MNEEKMKILNRLALIIPLVGTQGHSVDAAAPLQGSFEIDDGAVTSAIARTDPNHRKYWSTIRDEIKAELQSLQENLTERFQGSSTEPIDRLEAQINSSIESIDNILHNIVNKAIETALDRQYNYNLRVEGVGPEVLLARKLYRAGRNDLIEIMTPGDRNFFQELGTSDITQVRYTGERADDPVVSHTIAFIVN
jgi:uncharacterized protein YukE